MAACEKCWEESGGQVGEYRRLISWRHDSPCTPAEQCGDMHLIPPHESSCRCGMVASRTRTRFASISHLAADPER